MPEKRLTKEIAEQFLADQDSVDLSDFTDLDDEAAEILCGYEGERLHLDGLTSLSDMAAEDLREYSGSLSLNGLFAGIVKSVLDDPVFEQ
jgi:hypothetical protein